MSVLRIPRIYQQVQLPVSDQVQLERFVPVEDYITSADDGSSLMDSVALQDAVQVPQPGRVSAGCNRHSNP